MAVIRQAAELGFDPLKVAASHATQPCLTSPCARRQSAETMLGSC